MTPKISFKVLEMTKPAKFKLVLQSLCYICCFPLVYDEGRKPLVPTGSHPLTRIPPG